MQLTSSDIAFVTEGILYGPAGIRVSEIITDSRNAFIAPDAAFVAIIGINHDGHLFIGSLYNKGVRVFIVSELPADINNYPETAFIQCSNTVEGLQKIALWHRRRFRGKVIGITGSTGKTIVKEWLADILGKAYSVVRSPKSYNSQIGVPLSVLKLGNNYDYGIFEAGISFPGEMEKLERIIMPEAGIITNIGDAHRENFSGDREKGREKLRLFRNAGMIVYSRDQLLVRDLIGSDDKLRSAKLVGWSFSDTDAEVYVRITRSLKGHTIAEITFSGNTVEYDIPFTDRASVENAVTVASACLAMGIETATIRKGLSELTAVAMRMELKNGINNCQLIEDYYNSDPGSLLMALEFLKQFNGRKTSLILSDFLQTGRSEPELYSEVASLVAGTGINKFTGIGEALCRNCALFGPEAKFFHSTDEFIRRFSSDMYRDEIILIKGARIFEFERIGRLLEQQVHTTHLEINLDAISHNLNEFRRFLRPGTRIMAMVKAFAYGSGPLEIASLLEFHRVSYLAVANADEGAELREAGITMPVIVMNPDPSASDQLIRYNLEPEIYSFSALSSFVRVAARHCLVNYPVHIKIDTGMHRLGFLPAEIKELSVTLKSLNCIKVMSVFSHLAGSDDESLDEFTHRQADIFQNAASVIKNELGYPFLMHLLNTSGIARFPEYQFDMVRPGIGMYGIGRHPGLDLRPAGRFLTRISQVKVIPAGEPVGYGCRDVSEKQRVIAVLPVGYADGLNRKLGNGNGYLFIKGRRVEIAGNICMDMCMADITGLDAAEGDEAEIFGLNIKIEELAAICETIPYELLTSIPGRVKRIFFTE